MILQVANASTEASAGFTHFRQSTMRRISVNKTHLFIHALNTGFTARVPPLSRNSGVTE